MKLPTKATKLLAGILALTLALPLVGGTNEALGQDTDATTSVGTSAIANAAHGTAAASGAADSDTASTSASSITSTSSTRADAATSTPDTSTYNAASPSTELPQLETDIDDTKTAEVENKAEVIYTLLNYGGTVDEALVVNRFRLLSEGSFVDYGSYSKVQNLTSTTSIETSGDEVKLSAAEGDFYYQGTLKSPQLPWKISFEYTLDGKKIADAEVASLGGKSGRLGIKITTEPVEGVDPRFYEHYTLQIALTLPSNSIDNLSAEGATVATAGADTQVNYVVLPESTGNYDFAVDFETIDMPGISIAAVPYGMEFEMPDTSGMSEELTTLSNAIAELSNGTQQLNNGLATAATGLETIAGSSTQINNGLASLGEQSATIAASSQSLSAGLAGATGTLEQYAAVIANSTDLTQDEKDAILGTIVGLRSISDGYTQLDGGLQGYTGGVAGLASDYATFNNGLASSASGVRTLSNNLNTLSWGSAELSSGTQDMPAEMQKQIDEFAASYDFSGFEPASFVSSKNEKVSLVQFVFTTPALEPAEEVQHEDEIDAESSILDKLIALFTGE